MENVSARQIGRVIILRMFRVSDFSPSAFLVKDLALPRWEWQFFSEVFFFKCLLQNFICIVIYGLLGLHCCTRAFSSCGEWGRFSRCGAQASHWCGFFCCGAQALRVWLWLWSTGLVVHGTWDLPGSEMEPMSAALAGGFFTIGPAGKSHQ